MTNEKAERRKISEDLSIYDYCAGKQFSFEVNIEALFDLFDVVNDLTTIEIKRNKKNMVEDIALVKPRVDEDAIVFAMNNVIAFAQMKINAEIEDKDLEMLRRIRLKKFFVDKKEKERESET